MADTSFTITPGKAMEAITVTSGADSGQATLTVFFSTSVFSSKESAVRSLQEIIQFLEGWSFPPAARTP